MFSLFGSLTKNLKVVVFLIVQIYNTTTPLVKRRRFISSKRVVFEGIRAYFSSKRKNKKRALSKTKPALLLCWFEKLVFPVAAFFRNSRTCLCFFFACCYIKLYPTIHKMVLVAFGTAHEIGAFSII